uniref:SAC3/GANP/THP3 conserved domain-containing protein n=1 Tax=Lates calcarifer TaxID=8187 RepID=A0A4W6FLN6_LATCA
RSGCNVTSKQQRRNRLHHFEILAGTERDRQPRADPLRAVKEYSRPAAGKDSTNPADLRPLLADSTLPHLCLLSPLWRALRLYDPRINDTHLQENLSWLLDCYATVTELHPNQEEFQALGLLYNLGSARATQHIMELPERLRSAPRNPVRVLRLAQRLNFLQCCALHQHLVTCRRDLLLIFSHGYSSRNCRFPLDRLAQLLCLDVPLTARLCQAYRVDVSQDSHVVFSKAAFTEPEQGTLHCKLYHSIVAEKQRDLTVGSIIHGCA